MAEKKAENIIIEKLNNIAIDVAVIKTKAESTEDHLRTLNGKVQAHESRLQAAEGIVAVNSRMLASISDEEKTSKSFWLSNKEKLFWFVVACAWGVVMKLLK